MSDEITLYESKWLGLYRMGRWDYVRRPNSSACVGILAITDENEVILIEQFRIPVQNRVLEIPAGLVGDEVDFEDESLAQSAYRELLEETGFHAETVTPLISSPTSPGMTPEITHIFLAKNLTRQTEGGGVSGEDITVHIIPIQELRRFLSEKQSQGILLDFKIHAALAAAAISF